MRNDTAHSDSQTRPATQEPLTFDAPVKATAKPEGHPAPHHAPVKPPSKKSRSLPVLRGLASFLGFVFSVVILATVINLFIFQSYYVDGTSMTPTLQPNERLIINKVPRTWSRVRHNEFVPKRGEIVVFNSNLRSPDNGQFEQLIKRVIGLPGERVVVKDGNVTIFNHDHPQGFSPDSSLHLTLASTDGVIDEVVPAHAVFVMGDNRGPGGSYDSRTELGPIPVDQMVGELVMRLVPLNKAKLF